jgi:hypothetical protein
MWRTTPNLKKPIDLSNTSDSVFLKPTLLILIITFSSDWLSFVVLFLPKEQSFQCSLKSALASLLLFIVGTELD